MNDEARELKDIEIALYNKFKSLEKEDFLLKDEKWGEHERMDYDAMIEKLAEVVQQHLWDEELTLSDMNSIEESQWDKWIEEYEMPEAGCSCGYYCMDCLGMSWRDFM